jgi:hypothetical protein
MDELRIEIWDLIFLANSPKQIDEIADSTNQPIETIRTAVDHEWFNNDQGTITISHAVATSPGTTAQ